MRENEKKILIIRFHKNAEQKEFNKRENVVIIPAMTIQSLSGRNKTEN